MVLLLNLCLCHIFVVLKTCKCKIRTNKILLLGEVPSTVGCCCCDCSVMVLLCCDSSDLVVHVRGFLLRNGNQSKTELVISVSCSVGSGADLETS